MTYFNYCDGQLYAENLPVEQIAEAMDTPCYCHSASALRHNYKACTEHFKPKNSLVCSALKANSNQSDKSLSGRVGADADVVSEGELRGALNRTG